MSAEQKSIQKQALIDVGFTEAEAEAAIETPLFDEIYVFKTGFAELLDILADAKGRHSRLDITPVKPL